MSRTVIAVAASVLLVAGCAGRSGAPSQAALCRALGPTDRAQTQLNPQRAALTVVGDSYAAGWGTSPSQAWPRHLGRPVRVLAASGAGFTLNGLCGVGRYDSYRVRGPVIVQGGLNDAQHAHVGLRSAATRLFRRWHVVLAVGPAAAPSVDRAAEIAVDRTLREAARSTGTPYLSLLSVVPADGWSSDRLHPNAEGQEAIAAAVRARVRLSLAR